MLTQHEFLTPIIIVDSMLKYKKNSPSDELFYFLPEFDSTASPDLAFKTLQHRCGFRKGQGILQALYDQIIGPSLGDIPVYSDIPPY